MFTKSFKRCVASLLIMITVLGAMCPYTVYAASNSISISGFGAANLTSIKNYLVNGSTTKVWEVSASGDARERLNLEAVNSVGIKSSDDLYVLALADNVKYQENVISKVSDYVFDDFDGFSEKMASSLSNSLGATSQADITNLSQRFALLLYARQHPNLIKDSVDIPTDYSVILNTTLNKGHDKALGTLLRKSSLDILPSASEAESNLGDKAKIKSEDYVYSIYNLGVMSFKPLSDATGLSPTYTSLENYTTFLMNDYALHICISEYANFYLEDMEDIYNMDGWESSDICKAKLTYAKIFAEAFGSYVPVIRKIYTAKNVNCDSLSLEDMVSKANITSATLQDITVSLNSEYTFSYSTDIPMDMFYKIEKDDSVKSILTSAITGLESDSILSYDRDAILGDISVDTSLDQALTKKIEEQRRDNSVNLEDLYHKENILTVDSVKELNEYFGGDIATYIKSVQSFSSGPEEPIDSTGKATGATAVTMSDYILEGMGYSSTFVPMRTNLYSYDTVSQFDETFRNEFYYKYGFMRKALYIDTSGTAAMDYYNAGGHLTGSTKVCTLRDLMESGDNDVVLYIDSNFYNADEAVETGNTLLDSTLQRQQNLKEELESYVTFIGTIKGAAANAGSIVEEIIDNKGIAGLVYSYAVKQDENDDAILDADYFTENYRKEMLSRYKFDVNAYVNESSSNKVEATLASKQLINKYVSDLDYANSVSTWYSVDDQMLKTGDYTQYNGTIRAALAEIENSAYKDIDLDSESKYTEDSTDAIVLASTNIKSYLSMETKYTTTSTSDDGSTTSTSTYTTVSTYNPMVSFAYVSLLYRNKELYNLASTVENDNPVFIASDDLCGVDEANQWYRNSLLNYALLKNLSANAQVDYSYTLDLDCPVYMDVFGNILTESGTVVIPAACNATLHTGMYKNYNIAVGLYSCYGKAYSIPTTTPGAYSVLAPYFIADLNSECYVVSPINLSVDGRTALRIDRISTYDENTQAVIMDVYKSCVVEDNKTNLNWMAMVKICNEVMRGAPIESIDKEQENLYTSLSGNKSSIVATVKLEALLKSLQEQTSNSLISIPDFTRMDDMEVYIALLIKVIMVLTAAVVIVSIYRDGVAGTLGFRTFWTSVTSIALTLCCLITVPAVFQLTYYAANKFLLEDEAFRILLVNEEKRQGGIEIGITETNVVEDNNEFSLQLDWINVPWYKELETMLYSSTLTNLQETKLKAYQESEIYNNPDVDTYNDGVYVSTDKLFDSVKMDYTFNSTSGTKGLYLYAEENATQTAGFYSPYYVFLRILTANVNEYNDWRGNGYSSETEAYEAQANDVTTATSGYNYTTKYVSGNRLKTVGLCSNYFNSEEFLEYDTDIMRLYQIYGATTSDTDFIKQAISKHESTAFDRALLFNDTAILSFRSSLWYNDLNETEIDERIAVMDRYARDFIADNGDLITKVTDETFIKTMALYMAVKYNQLFGVCSANALEIYNLDSNDLVRLCIVSGEDAVMATPMSYSRFVYNFGGEASVYIATILELILWIGSYIKPLCTIIVFISVFMSVWVFRVMLKKPSANLWGYLCTVALLCGTNILHAIVLKLGVNLPNWGLSTLGCLIFLVIMQVLYLLVLAYVTGVSLKDWSNLGMSEYAKEASLIKSKFKKEDTTAMLSGTVKHHEDNWEYYNDLVAQHRSRNKT